MVTGRKVEGEKFVSDLTEENVHMGIDASLNINVEFATGTAMALTTAEEDMNHHEMIMTGMVVIGI